MPNNQQTGKKVVISVLGQDRPGIIAQISKTLFHHQCNIENVSQTILQSEFSGIFIVVVPDSIGIEQLHKELTEESSRLGLHIFIKTMESEPETAPSPGSPFVITTQGPDRKGLVATITGILAGFNVNVTHLQAVFKGGDDPTRNIMIYEVDIPDSIEQKTLEAALRQKADELGLTLSIQHRKIFEAINRI